MTLAIELLEQSFDQIKPQATEFAERFYGNLFEGNPEVRSLFARSDMAAQQQKLLESLVFVVSNLRNPEVMVKAVRGLGTRHVKYGIVPEHYPLVGAALLQTFAEFLQEDWTPELAAAWAAAYATLSALMLEGDAA
ncbi:MAG: globin domain-containing protein [Oculatellaceae cyanobacterium Prado106]|jgi:hemoglobin-like flavoprotein|nr:globin domain-containing protein [Oculatellaceae cyanobacterium Prado106]